LLGDRALGLARRLQSSRGMKRYSLFVTAMFFFACSSEGRKATIAEQQSATDFVRAALSVRGSFAAPDAMPSLPVGFALLPDGTPDCVVRSTSGGVEKLTFHCTDGGITIDGTLTRGGDRVTIDLHASGRVSMDYTGDLTVTDTDVNGTLTLRAQTPDVSVSASAAYDHIGLDAAHCPVAGRLRFDADVNVKGQSQSRALEIGFGPACGDVTVFD